ncbi:lasso RiPP family leader peptide-containing protein [Streptomyces sp. UNOB3_S3]|nr:lasso RiPP family leader peptide-containing protein [Streptomyces sp. UNOB3_S3]MCC3775081.1 lasso RiPP family leader peptide-containing protein [Streptomyces sp. UNOB3_S3]
METYDLYEAPMMVEVGEFAELTRGPYLCCTYWDGNGYYYY